MHKRAFQAATFAVLIATGPALAGTIAPADVKINDMAVTQALTGTAGAPVAGREVFADRKLGNCLACHVNSEQAEQPFHGEIGPPLDGVADRWGAAELRAIIIDSKAIFGDQTIMPGFYTLDVGARVAEDFQGKTILSAQDVEDVLAYLLTLKE